MDCSSWLIFEMIKPGGEDDGRIQGDLALVDKHYIDIVGDIL